MVTLHTVFGEKVKTRVIHNTHMIHNPTFTLKTERTLYRYCLLYTEHEQGRFKLCLSKMGNEQHQCIALLGLDKNYDQEEIVVAFSCSLLGGVFRYNSFSLVPETLGVFFT